MDLNCSTVTCRQFLKLDIRSMKFSCKAYTWLPVVPGLGFRVTGNLSFHRYHVTALSKIAHGAARCKGFRRFFVLGFVQCLWRGVISASLGYTQRCVSYYSTGRRGLQGFSLLAMRTAGWTFFFTSKKRRGRAFARLPPLGVCSYYINKCLRLLLGLPVLMPRGSRRCLPSRCRRSLSKLCCRPCR